MYERFTDRARRVMRLANQEAERLNHEYVGTEHILLGLTKETSGNAGAFAGAVLAKLGVCPCKIRLEVEKIVQTGPGGDQVVLGKLPHTPRAKKVIELAIQAADVLKDKHVGTEHILSGLTRESQGVAAQILAGLGVTSERVGTILLEAGRSPPEAPPSPPVPAPELPPWQLSYILSTSPQPVPAPSPADEYLRQSLRSSQRVAYLKQALARGEVEERARCQAAWEKVPEGQRAFLKPPSG